MIRYEPLIFLVCIWLSVWANACPAVVQASSIGLNPTEKLWAARACFAEASFRTDDCTEILSTITDRAQAGQWLWMLRRYCSGRREGLKRPTARQAEIRTYPWADVPGKSPRFNKKWAELRLHVTEWADGKHKSKCNATHWGGRRDKPRGGMVPAACMGTANTFYVVER